MKNREELNKVPKESFYLRNLESSKFLILNIKNPIEGSMFKYFGNINSFPLQINFSEDSYANTYYHLRIEGDEIMFSSCRFFKWERKIYHYYNLLTPKKDVTITIQYEKESFITTIDNVKFEYKPVHNVEKINKILIGSGIESKIKAHVLQYEKCFIDTINVIQIPYKDLCFSF